MATARSSRARADGIDVTAPTGSEVAHDARGDWRRRSNGSGVKPGDRVATLAMNHDRHLSPGSGWSAWAAFSTPLNPRLFDDQLEYIVNHAEDRVLLYDRAFAPLIERLKPRWTTIDALHLLRRRVRRFAGGRRRRLSLARRRRARAVRPLLHQRHDRQPEGRALRASLDRAPRDVRSSRPTSSTSRRAR